MPPSHATFKIEIFYVNIWYLFLQRLLSTISLIVQSYAYRRIILNFAYCKDTIEMIYSIVYKIKLQDKYTDLLTFIAAAQTEFSNFPIWQAFIFLGSVSHEFSFILIIGYRSLSLFSWRTFLLYRSAECRRLKYLFS